jgi:hypothetical protein
MAALGISWNCLSFGDFESTWFGRSVDDGVVDAALRRDELSVAEAVVLVLEAPLPL